MTVLFLPTSVFCQLSNPAPDNLVITMRQNDYTWAINRDNNNEIGCSTQIEQTENGNFLLGIFDIQIPNGVVLGEEGLSEMYLYAYENEFNNMVGISAPLIFEPFEDVLFSGNNKINLNQYFFSLSHINSCSKSVNNVNYTKDINVTLVKQVGEDAYESYIWLNSKNTTLEQLYGNLDYESTFDISVTLNFCCPRSAPNPLSREENVRDEQFSNQIRLNNGFSGFSEGESGMIRVFPNPFNDYLFITTSSSELDEITNFIIYDSTGRSLFQETKLNQGTLQKIDLSYLESGIFFVQIRTGTSYKIFKVTKN